MKTVKHFSWMNCEYFLKGGEGFFVVWKWNATGELFFYVDIPNPHVVNVSLVLQRIKRSCSQNLSLGNLEISWLQSTGAILPTPERQMDRDDGLKPKKTKTKEKEKKEKRRKLKGLIHSFLVWEKIFYRVYKGKMFLSQIRIVLLTERSFC